MYEHFFGLSYSFKSLSEIIIDIATSEFEYSGCVYRIRLFWDGPGELWRIWVSQFQEVYDFFEYRNLMNKSYEERFDYYMRVDVWHHGV